MEYYSPDFLLHPDLYNSKLENCNTRQYLDYVRQTIHENLKNTAHAPSVQMQYVPETFFTGERQDEKDPEVVEDNVTMSSERFVILKFFKSVKAKVMNFLNFIKDYAKE